jgi:hypothetical protein
MLFSISLRVFLVYPLNNPPIFWGVRCRKGEGNYRCHATTIKIDHLNTGGKKKTIDKI